LQAGGAVHLTVDPSAFSGGLAAAAGAPFALAPNIVDVSQLVGAGGMQVLQNAALVPSQGPGGQTVWVLANQGLGQGQYPQFTNM
jgi:hypothetical protein